ncbi:prepilin peptidase [Paenibacillus sp. MBLB4367]|uniref:prepilin peptidase n=1 Tax=Paenibacillus sp. MBLB4367 TaxID=3384767 RepID=UPI0039083C31
MLIDLADFYGTMLRDNLWLLSAVSAALGLLVGSFLNVVAIRLPLKRSIVYPPSHCTSCKHRLHAVDLIPVVSYLLLRGKCRYCGHQVSSFYAVGEVVTAALFAVIAWQTGFSANLVIGLLFAAVLVTASISDLHYRLIPDRLVLFGVVAGGLLRLWNHPLPLWNYAVASLLGGAILFALASLASSLMKKEALGGGDLKLFAFVGIVLGIKLTLLTLFVSSLLGSVIGILLIASGKIKREAYLPFGPFIGLAGVLVFLWGERWIDFYFSLILG